MTVSTRQRAPFFSVVIATHARGRHILPTIRSVLAQDLSDFEILVVGDASTDDTESIVASLADSRLRWLNLATRCGSQSGPNNAGIAAAKGEVIAYLGHDDIWEPDHLSRLAALYRSDTPPDFAVSGSIFHLPNGTSGHEVMGLFDDGANISSYFFPPSSFSHRKPVIEVIGPWRMPEDCRAPVDEDLLLRALAAGMLFRSTGVVTLHKFAAGHRYLSYVRQESHEQAAMLAELGTADHDRHVAAKIEEARRLGCFMVKRNRDFSQYKLGELAQINAERKGLHARPLQPLGDGVTLRHKPEQAALDWRRKPVLGFRVNYRNPWPRLLVPVTGGRARLRFTIACRDAQALSPITMDCNGTLSVARPGRRWFGLIAWFAAYEVEIELQANQPTLLELQLTKQQQPIRKRRRLAIGPLRLRPV
jgi:glycosyltransferase involved in cell wall biosynthesis